MILPDYPIGDKSADKLRRAPLAEKVAELVSNFKGEESFVIGIEGIWGSGKTSFINLVVSNLNLEQTSVVTFNPWNFSGQNELIGDFFSTLVAGIEFFRTDKAKAKKIKSIVSKLTRKSEVAFSPEITAFGGMVNFKANDLFKFSGDEKTLQEERKEIDGLFKMLDKRVVIIIDDIDRLDTEETRLIMKLVKMSANFPNTVFLLAYDREKVAEKLGDKGIGEEYLKKIIQVSFTLPRPDEQGLRKILYGDLDETIKAVYGAFKLEGEDEKRWQEIGYAGFPNLFATVRDVKRFISSLRLNWSIIGEGEVNMIDFIAIEAIRVFAPLFYSAISGNRSLFTGPESSYPLLRANKQTARTTRYNELLEKAPAEVRTIIDKVCQEIFPQMGSNYGGSSEEKWRRDKRICAEERFDFYFQLGIPEGAVSEGEITSVLKSLEKKEEFEESLLRFYKDKRLRTLLSKLLDYVDKLTKETARILIITLWNLEKQIADEPEAAFDFDDVDNQTMRLSYHSIKRAVPKDQRKVFVEEVVKESKTLYPPVQFIGILEQEREKGGKAEEEYLVYKADVDEPKTRLLERIRAAAKDGTLPNESKFVYLLFRWKKLGNEEEVKKYVENLITTRIGLLAYLKGFVGKVYSSNGNYSQIDQKSVAEFSSKETLDALVGEITEDELSGMGEKEKEAVNLYRKPRDIWSN